MLAREGSSKLACDGQAVMWREGPRAACCERLRFLGWENDSEDTSVELKEVARVWPEGVGEGMRWRVREQTTTGEMWRRYTRGDGTRVDAPHKRTYGEVGMCPAASVSTFDLCGHVFVREMRGYPWWPLARSDITMMQPWLVSSALCSLLGLCHDYHRMRHTCIDVQYPTRR